jgi:UDP-N-acetylglucosamine--N-acetylmuramyl-(pentapeptide) pyrophosphoryl-undecaprenol N-acetylglucosamine transferase
MVSRAGAIAISELCISGKPSILVPSPNVAEDHQTKNALALSSREAAIFVKDAEASEKLIDTAIALAKNKDEQIKLAANISSMAMHNSAALIAAQVFGLAKNKSNKVL